MTDNTEILCDPDASEKFQDDKPMSSNDLYSAEP